MIFNNRFATLQQQKIVEIHIEMKNCVHLVVQMFRVLYKENEQY